MPIVQPVPSAAMTNRLPAPDGVTEALAALRDGDDGARDRLVRAVYDELRVIARAHLRHERDDHTLVTTALVHEAYEKVLGGENAPSVSYSGRGHFFGAAARAMRQILVDHARKRSRAKRGSGVRPVALTAVGEVAAEQQTVDVVDLDAALTRLATMDERQARVVECRYFGGLSIEETAEALGISTATVKREWRMARAWLYAALHDDGT
ncbi:MAG: sigma-70 family RNA polymerase sigma factor [Bacteroidota bacterium]